MKITVKKLAVSGVILSPSWQAIATPTVSSAKATNIGPGQAQRSAQQAAAYPFMKESDVVSPGAKVQRVDASHGSIDLGGVETLTAGQQQLIKRCAMISVACELMEKEAISGQPLNAIAYGTLTGHLTRTLNALGLKREPIDVTPALHQYLDTLQPADTQDAIAATPTSRADVEG